MKKGILKLSVMLVSLVAMSVVIVSCKGKPKDSDIQKEVTEKIAAMPGASGVTASVAEGIVTLSGTVKDEAEKMAIETTVKGLKGVKSVVNSITIPAPVVITPDDPLMQSGKDATKDFPTVMATVKDGVVTLTGEIKRVDLKNLIMTLNSLQPKKIDNQLTIK